ncbi:phosphorylase superfamily protein [Apiospora saccharicola]|uniref:Phosphorylase superfamily protein n=1 Tax=Apiospora saccharicola TaxID=335842 RepID=A0ABR1UY36_9PEZI
MLTTILLSGVVLRNKAGDWISRQLRFDALTKATRSYAVSVTPDHTQIPLCQWTSDHFVRLGQYVYFGHVLDKINPNRFHSLSYAPVSMKMQLVSVGGTNSI